MVRVAGLHDQVEPKIDARGADAMSAADVIELIRAADDRPARAARPLLRGRDPPGPRRARDPDHLADRRNASEREEVEQLFQSQVFPALTPLVIGRGRPFPYISNLSLSIGVLLRNPEKDEEVAARVKVPKELLRRFLLDRRRPHLRPARGRDRRQPGRPLPGDGDRPPLALPGYPRHRLRRLRRGRRSAAGGRGGGATPALRRGGAARGRARTWSRGCGTSWSRRWTSRAARSTRSPGLLGAGRSHRHLLDPGVPRAALSAVEGRHPAAAPAGKPDPAGGGRLRRDAPGRHPRPPSLRLLRGLRRALRPAGGRGPERPRDQADGLPDQRGLAAGAGPDRGLGAGQAGGLPGGAEGALRRERQHPLGEGAGGGRASTSSTGSPG